MPILNCSLKGWTKMNKFSPAQFLVAIGIILLSVGLLLQSERIGHLEDQIDMLTKAMSDHLSDNALLSVTLVDKVVSLSVDDNLDENFEIYILETEVVKNEEITWEPNKFRLSAAISNASTVNFHRIDNSYAFRKINVAVCAPKGLNSADEIVTYFNGHYHGDIPPHWDSALNDIREGIYPLSCR